MIVDSDIAIIQHLMGENTFTDTSKIVEFSYISNPDDTIRWIYPKELKQAYFLNFYSTASFRAKILSTLIKLAFYTGQSHRVKSGDLQLNITDDSPLGKVLDKYPNTEFSIFTGTVGENRKAVIEIHDKKEVLVFVKIALTEAAKILVENEAKCLQNLNTFQFSSLVVPKLLSKNKLDTIGLSNIKPKNFQQNTTLSQLHIDAMSELYAKTHVQTKWTNLNTLTESKERVENLLLDFEVINELEKSRILSLANKLLTLISILEEEDEKLVTTLSHGDFTPWNMYSTKNVLHLFDWELSENDTPILFDLFHFIFQSEAMVKHTEYTGISKEIQRVLQMQNTKNIITNFDVNVNKHYIFYLVYNVAYYLSKYSKQEHLHEQVFWLIDIWEYTVNDAIDKQGVLFEK